MGEPWPGVRGARAGARDEAAKGAGKRAGALRRERQGLYDTWLATAAAGRGAPCRRAETARESAKAEAEDRPWTSARTISGRSPRRPRTASRTSCRRARIPMGLDVGTSKVVAARKTRQGHRDRRRAERLHPRALLALHRDDPRPERHRVLPRGRRADHLRHAPPRSSPTCSTPRRARPMSKGCSTRARSSATAGARGDPAERDPEGAHAGRDAGLLGAGGQRRARRRS